MKNKSVLAYVAIILTCILPEQVLAKPIAESQLSVWWGFPFAAILLSMAIVPMIVPKFWHHHFGKVIAFWTLCFLIPFTYVFGIEASITSVVHVLVGEYIPFVVLLLALFVVAGGIYIQVNVPVTPWVNVGFLFVGAVLASFMGTTGASMLLIRPLLRVNANRVYRVHTIVFFIFIVSNIGGALTPLGDPPLFLGFLQGVGFFWTLQHLWPQTLFLLVVLFVLFIGIDFWLLALERKRGIANFNMPSVEHGIPKFVITGQMNFLWLLCVVILVLISGAWSSEIVFSVMEAEMHLPALLRNIGLVVVAIISMWVTPKEIRRMNGFDWESMKEVGKLFLGIFLTIAPVIAMLRAGSNGVFAPLLDVVNQQGEPIPYMYFWVTGALSAFLDNAPTYLVFFNTASGDAAVLMTSLSSTLMAISAGAVFMGAGSYIGNAPNLMVKSIAESSGVKMPSFFGYMVWSICILLPLFFIISLIWYR